MPVTATAQTTLEELRAAINEGRFDALEACYAEDAVILHYSERNRPGSAQPMSPKELVETYGNKPPAGRTDEVIDGIAGDDRLAYAVKCTYGTGELVMFTAVCEVQDGRITRQIGVEAWDE